MICSVLADVNDRHPGRRMGHHGCELSSPCQEDRQRNIDEWATGRSRFKYRVEWKEFADRCMPCVAHERPFMSGQPGSTLNPRWLKPFFRQPVCDVVCQSQACICCLYQGAYVSKGVFDAPGRGFGIQAPELGPSLSGNGVATGPEQFDVDDNECG